MNVNFRPFEISDVDQVLDFWSNIDGIFLHSNGEDSSAGIISYLKRNPSFSFIAQKHSDIVGAIMAGHDGRRGFIHHLAVSPSIRIALPLLEAAPREASCLINDGVCTRGSNN